MTAVSDILNSKTNTVMHQIAPSALVFDAIKLMAQHSIGALLVIEDERIVGIFTERDYARKLVLQGRASGATQVRDVMTRNVICVRPQQTSEECMALMTQNRLRHLPVVDEAGKLQGMLSIGDLVKDIIREQQFIIEQLTHYIHGGGR